MKNVTADHSYSTPADTPERRGPHRLALRYGRSRKCVSSKAALLILLWSFVIGLLRGVMINPDVLSLLMWFINFFELFAYGVVAFSTCFFPLAGFLADIKCGRYKVVVISLCIVSVSAFSLLLVIGLYIAFNFVDHSNLILIVVCSTISIAAMLVLYIGIIGFTANAVQFGMDQLHDSPGEDRTLFIHWYVWTYYACIFIDSVASNTIIQRPYNAFHFNAYTITGCCLIALIFLLVILVLPITFCLVQRRRRWFLIEPGQYNPYKLVYRVTKFAHQHKIPVRRSAFTYCEDEVPRGLDLGKKKYGGPFTTEQVEDVKAFYGILKVLCSLGAVFFLEFAASSMLPRYALHTAAHYSNASDPLNTFHTVYKGTVIDQVLINKGALLSLVAVVCIPLYLFLLRPFISRYVPGMLKRMGLGMVLVLLSLLTTFSMDTAVHMEGEINSTSCMFRNLAPSFSQNSTYLVIQLTLCGVSRVLIYTGAFEFICSQSPHSMKGLLLGVLYAIRGLYQVVAVLHALPYYTLDVSMYPSCGFYFYLVNLSIGLVAVLVYVWVAKRYRYRVRDEVCNIHQYAEEYYFPASAAREVL